MVGGWVALGPQLSFRRRNYVETSITVLSPVDVGDNAASVLLEAARRAVDDDGVAVWSVCIDWGSRVVVHETVMSGGR
jgi:hypothetical protein